jgi:hypothetical protein
MECDTTNKNYLSKKDTNDSTSFTYCVTDCPTNYSPTENLCTLDTEKTAKVISYNFNIPKTEFENLGTASGFTVAVENVGAENADTSNGRPAKNRGLFFNSSDSSTVVLKIS